MSSWTWLASRVASRSAVAVAREVVRCALRVVRRACVRAALRVWFCARVPAAFLAAVLRLVAAALRSLVSGVAISGLPPRDLFLLHLTLFAAYQRTHVCKPLPEAC